MWFVSTFIFVERCKGNAFSTFLPNFSELFNIS